MSFVPRPSLGLYLHIPFCSHICSYCNFNRGLFDASLKAAYVDALATEIARAGDGSPADTIFFGGGTPSLLDPAEIARLVDACRMAFDLAPGAEITLETNPETVTTAKMAALLEAGVTRVSLGVQSRDERELRLVAPIGNVRDGSMRDIWYGTTAKERRAKSTKCTIACSENCTIKRSIPQQVAGAVRLLTNQA